MRYLTAGESHGKALVGILEGLPSNFTIDAKRIDADLAARQSGYGRGGRMKIERDAVEILTGVRGGLTLGSPVAVLIKNLDYQNWAPYMDAAECDFETKKVTAPRPGHADKAGCAKYDFLDARNILERASARNTAVTVALGSIAKQILAPLGIKTASFVRQIGRAVSTQKYTDCDTILTAAAASPVRAIDKTAEKDMLAEIENAQKSLDTVGGEFVLVASGIKAGLGSCMHWDSRLDTAIFGAVGGLQGVKSVSIGAGAAFAEKTGTQIHDPMLLHDGLVCRPSNNAGGIEGGISNGEDIVVSAVFKPIPTTMKGLPTVDLLTSAQTVSSKERSDVCAVPAAAVVGEAILALTLCDFVLKKTGGDSFKEVLRAWKLL